MNEPDFLSSISIKNIKKQDFFEDVDGCNGVLDYIINKINIEDFNPEKAKNFTDNTLTRAVFENIISVETEKKIRFFLKNT